MALHEVMLLQNRGSFGAEFAKFCRGRFAQSVFVPQESRLIASSLEEGSVALLRAFLHGGCARAWLGLIKVVDNNRLGVKVLRKADLAS